MVYTKEELYDVETHRTFAGEDMEVAFLLGGIGTGNVSLGSRGELRDWELFNSSSKGGIVPNAGFMIRAQEKGKAPIAKVLESRIQSPYYVSHGLRSTDFAGLPRMRSSRMTAQYPMAWVEFEDAALPVQVKLEAYTPLIPLNIKDSSIPCAVFTYTVTNPSDQPVDVTIVGSMMNPIGGITYNKLHKPDIRHLRGNANELRQQESMAGLYFSSTHYAEVDLNYGNLALVTTNPNITAKPVWYRGMWFDAQHDFWDDLLEDGRLEDLNYESPSSEAKTDTGSIGAYETLQPGEMKSFKFFLTWYFPNRVNGYEESVRVKEPGKEVAQNYYVNHFSNAWSVAEYIINQEARLREETMCFYTALYSSTLPGYVRDAIASNLTVFRSNTCFFLKNGRFYGYEGCHDQSGCCPGSCTHVWNYAQSLAFLFPTLERDMRRAEFLEEVEEDGRMIFRAYRSFGTVFNWHDPASADGQMGSIMRVYREWKLSGDDDFIRSLWPFIKKAIAYAFIHWDKDQDYVFEASQHVSYDVDFVGPNPLTGTYLLGALSAAARMADYLGDQEASAKYHEALERSSQRLDELTWNGEYYVQRLEEVDAYKYQYGIGCLSDQLQGQQSALLYGLGYVLPEEKVKQAARAIYTYNFLTDFSEHANNQRTYALNDEKGLLICTWPEGGRPRFPFVYSDEVWTGVEYAVATQLIYAGCIEEGLTIVKAVQERYDGKHRNPFNEIECGHHYCRSLSSWGLLISLTGFTYDMVSKEISFEPVLLQGEAFQSFWSIGCAWGTYKQSLNRVTGAWEPSVEVLYGDASGITVEACGKRWTL